MKNINFSRRSVLLGTAVLPLRQIASSPRISNNVVIASANGLRACAKAMEVLKAGGDTLDAVIAGVNINEEDPTDTSVGYGGLPNEDGVVELDACVMHGPTRRGGAVATLRGIKTPSRIAKLVMEETDHMMLVGEGALRFAKAYGFKEEDLLTEKSRLAWLVWKQSLRDAHGHNNWGPGLDSLPGKKLVDLKRAFPNVDEQTLTWAWEVALHPPTGTISCLALNGKGEISGVTTTSGLAWKIAGRVGDSPLIGAGLYVDQDVGAAGSTGRGEENIRVCGAHTIVENMRRKMSPREAILDALNRVARNFDCDRNRLADVNLYFYALRKDGEYAGASLWDKNSPQGPPAQLAVCTAEAPSHLEPADFLYRRG